MIYVMSDIHGCDGRYRNILKQIKLKADDHLYILGDVIDRGPRGLSILRETMQKENITLLMGNHEHMMLEVLTDPDDADALWLWYRNGGKVSKEQPPPKPDAQEPAEADNDTSEGDDTITMAMALLVIENTHLREIIRNLRDTISGLTDHKFL